MFRPKVKECDYCRFEDAIIGKRCPKCGAMIETPEWIRGLPFEYKGMIVLIERRWHMQDLKTSFWQGTKYLGSVYVTVEERMINVPEYCDPMSYIYERFKEKCLDSS